MKKAVRNEEVAQLKFLMMVHPSAEITFETKEDEVDVSVSTASGVCANFSIDSQASKHGVVVAWFLSFSAKDKKFRKDISELPFVNPHHQAKCTLHFPTAESLVMHIHNVLVLDEKNELFETSTPFENKTVSMTLTTAQASAVAKALDVYSRLGLCQFEQLVEMASMNMLVHESGRVLAPEELDEFRGLVDKIKQVFGFHSGASFGSTDPKLNKQFARSYEVCKALKQALAFGREPKPKFLNVDYDGVIFRVTDDPLPKASCK